MNTLELGLKAMKPILKTLARNVPRKDEIGPNLRNRNIEAIDQMEMFYQLQSKLNGHWSLYKQRLEDTMRTLDNIGPPPRMFLDPPAAPRGQIPRHGSITIDPAATRSRRGFQ